MKLKSLKVEALFNTFSYDLQFNSQDKYLILTGINGYGKTTILNMISALAIKDLYYFYTVPFASIDFEFEDGSVLSLSSDRVDDITSADVPVRGGRRLLFNMRESDRDSKAIGSFSIDADTIDRVMKTNYHFSHISINNRLKEDYESADFYQVMKDEGLLKAIMQFTGKNAEQMMMRLDAFKASFIEAERTVECRYLRPKNSVPNLEYRDPKWFLIDHLVSDFRYMLNNEYANFVKYSQQVDSDFINQAVSSSLVYNQNTYDAEREKLIIRAKELELLGLIPHLDVKPYDEVNAKMLTAYIVAQNKKMDFYNTLLSKIRLFYKLVEERGFVNKNMSVTVKDGFRFRADGNGFIDLSLLSSGEQNEVVMLYTLVFSVEDDSMLLIDEPENSLHVLWQKKFMRTIEEVSTVKNLFVIVATHSPQIIGTRWDNCCDLTELMGGENDGE
jgi:Predicted ATP-binding protein involved in virulence